MNSRFHLIRNIYIGRPRDEPGDREDTSTVWPLTIVCRLLWECKKLEHLTLLYLNRHKWVEVEHAIPATLKTLVLGPIHGPFRASNLPQRPQLEHFTSSHTFMRDDEVADLVLYPLMKIFRRITTLTNMGRLLAVGQVPRTMTLEEIEIVVSGPTEYSTLATSYSKRKLDEKTSDPRIKVRHDLRHWLQMVFDEFLEYRPSNGT